PIIKAVRAAHVTEKWPSCQAAPNATADKPIIEPTDKSIPPEMMTGVRATAIKPSSTLNRVTSKKLAAEKKFGATTENTAISASNATNSVHSAFGIRLNRTEFNAAARPVNAPRVVNTENLTSEVDMPASRAASSLEPVAKIVRPAWILRRLHAMEAVRPTAISSTIAG